MPDKSTVPNNPGPSTAFFYQRLRVGTDFIVSPGLKLVTRFDALERIWGGARSAPASGTLSPVTGAGYSPLAIDSAGTTAENENIAFDLAYIDYVSPIGTFDIGYMIISTTGTVFGNNSTPGPRIKFTSNPFGGFTISADITKIADNSYNSVNSSTYFTNATNADNNQYGLEGYYTWKGGKGGSSPRAGGRSGSGAPPFKPGRFRGRLGHAHRHEIQSGRRGPGLRCGDARADRREDPGRAR